MYNRNIPTLQISEINTLPKNVFRIAVENYECKLNKGVSSSSVAFVNCFLLTLGICINYFNPIWASH